MRRILAHASLLWLTFAASGSAFASNYQTVDFTAAHLGGKTARLIVILPADYTTTTRRFPVIYLLHGWTSTPDMLVTRTGLLKFAKAYEQIFVLPYCENGFYVNNYSNPEMRWEDFITMDLIPYVDEHYRTIALRGDRAVAGISMGGFGAVMLGLKHLDMFGWVGSLGGAIASAEPEFAARFAGEDIKDTRTQDLMNTLAMDFGPPGNPKRSEEDPFWLVQRVQPPSCPRIFIAVGTEDGFLQDNRRFVNLLLELHIRYRYYEVPGGHDWQVWDEQIENVLMLEAKFLGVQSSDHSN